MTGRHGRQQERVAAARAPHSHRALIGAAILGPTLLFAAFSWWSHNRTIREFDAESARAVAILAEQGLRLMQVDELLLRQIDERVADLGDSQMVAAAPQLHLLLQDSIPGLPEVENVFICDERGNLLASSRASPLPGNRASQPSSAASRDYFIAARGGAALTIGGPYRSRRTGRPIFTVAQRLQDRQGEFRGIAVIVVSTERMAASWRALAAAGDEVSLMRADGTVLARYPAPPSDSEAAPPQLAAASRPPIGGAASGQFVALPAPPDGIVRHVAFRKLGDYPLYVLYAVDSANVLRSWYATLAAFGGLAAAAALALVFAALAVIRTARGETAALARAETAARELLLSEESQRTLFRMTPTATQSVDADFRILDVNDRWVDLFGYRREEVVGRPIADFYEGGADELYQQRNAELVRAGTLVEIERRCIRKSGEAFDALISVVLERGPGGECQRSIATIIDSTARRRAEEAVRRERRLSELLIDSSIDGIIGKDDRLRYTVWNGGMERLTGVPRDRVIGRTTTELFPHFSNARLDAAWAAALAGETTVIADEPYVISDVGREGYCDQTVSPLRDAGGAIIGAIAIVRERSQQHRLDEMMRQAQKMEAVGQLTGGIAHDFNNLLTVIIGNVEALLRRAAQRYGDTELRRLGEAAMRGADRAAVLTQRLLAFSRRQPLDPKPLDPNRLVAGMSELLRRTLGEGIVIETVLSGGLWRVLADANQLENALLNLAVNARDAMPDGGKLTIATENSWLEANAAEGVAAGPNVMLAVSDTGSGMAQEVMARAIEPFFTTKDVGKGSGLGLSQVYGFVKQSGGHLRIDSEPGHGTAVRLYLPRLGDGETAIEEAAAGAPVPTAPAGHDSVLVVEDDDDVRAHTALVLRELGYRVFEAADGGAALAHFANGTRIDLLFTDIGLPGELDGRALATRLRAAAPRLKILFTTGYARAGSLREEGFDPGSEMLLKPFSFSALAVKIRQVLDAKAPVSG